MKYVYCEEAKKMLENSNINCCSSCHTDHEEYGYDLLGGGISDNEQEFHICCKILFELEKNNRLNL